MGLGRRQAEPRRRRDGSQRRRPLPQPAGEGRWPARTPGCSSTTPSTSALRRALDGEVSRQTLELYGPPQVAVVVAAEPLPDGSAVATVEDVSDRRRVDAVRTDFVANISHELKTPVGALAVLAEALADEDDVTVVHRVAERMVSESHRVARTIDDLMELSRIELGEEPVRDTVPVIDVVSGAIDRALPLSEARNIDVAVLDVPDERRRARRPPAAHVGARQPGRERGQVLRGRRQRADPRARGRGYASPS